MKVGIVTITEGENYGNRLQNYAAQVTLKKLGCEVDTIFNNYNFNTNLVKREIKNLVVIICNIFNIDGGYKINNARRIRKFRLFNDKLIKRSKYELGKGYAPEGLKDYYDFFVTGSDQVWNPEFLFNSNVEFLTFAKPGQRIAYSASFGISKLPDSCRENYKKWINDMDYLSVREEAGADIIKELTGRDAEVLVDPTVMLTKDEWLSIAEKPKCYKGKKYILTYFLGKMSEEVNVKLNKLAEQNDYEIINLLDKKNREIYSVDPSEFIWLINNTELMCTDSFHGVVFSLIMKTPFVVFNRVNKGGAMNSRIDTLLKLFNKEERYGMDLNNKELFNMDFSNIDSTMDVERERAYKYLKNALGL